MSSSRGLALALVAVLVALSVTLGWVLSRPASDGAVVSARAERRLKAAQADPGAAPQASAPSLAQAPTGQAPTVPAPAATDVAAPAVPTTEAKTTVATTDAASPAVACVPYEPMTYEQKGRLEKAFLGQKLKVELGFYGDTSTSALASQIAYVLALDSIDAKVYGGGTLSRPDETGVELYLRDHLHPSKKAADILKRFATAGIPTTLLEMPKGEDASVDLFVFVAPRTAGCRP